MRVVRFSTLNTLGQRRGPALDGKHATRTLQDDAGDEPAGDTMLLQASGGIPAAPAVAPAARQLQRLTKPGRISSPRRYALAPVAGKVAAALRADVTRERGQGLFFLLVPVALGVGAALALAALRQPDAVAVACGMLFALAAAAMLHSRAPDTSRLAALAGLLLAGALAALFEEARGPVLIDSPVVTTITGTVETREVTGDGRIRYRVRLEATADPQIRRPPETVRVTARNGGTVFQPGDRITGRARLAPPSGPALSGGYDFAYQAYFSGTGAYGFFFRAPEPVSAETGQAADGPLRNLEREIRLVREQVAARIRAILPGDAGAIAAALTVSDRSGISDDAVDALRATGLAHILAISGLHMALAAGTLYVTLRRLMALSPRLAEAVPVKKWAAAGALLSAFAYLILSGASVPTQRAFIMLAVILGAVMIDRPALTMRNLAIAAIVIILISPSSVSTPGFQMSFAATAALIAAYAAWPAGQEDERRPVSIFLRGPTGWALRAIGALAMTALVAGVATGLFSAHHFHRFAANGLLSNVAAMPIVTLIVMPSGLAAMLAMPFGLDGVPLAIMGWGLEQVIRIARFTQSIGGDLTTGRLPVHATAVAAAGFVALVFLRTRLRLAGLIPVATGLVMMVSAGRGSDPDLVIAEGARLIAAVHDSGLAVNTARPPDFIFTQWQTALARSQVVAPDVSARPEDGEATARVALTDLVSRAKDTPETGLPRFRCAGRDICVLSIKGRIVVAVADPALIGTACDLADLVILEAAIRTRTCRSGAVLVTGRTLRETGALEVTFSDEIGERAQSGSRAGATDAGLRGIDMKGAVEGIRRGWTRHRYYDWRSDRFVYPDGTSEPAAGDTVPALPAAAGPVSDSGG